VKFGIALTWPNLTSYRRSAVTCNSLIIWASSVDDIAIIRLLDPTVLIYLYMLRSKFRSTCSLGLYGLMALSFNYYQIMMRIKIRLGPA